MNENLQNIFIEEFLKRFDEKEQKKILINRDQQIIAERKSKKLNPVREFLKHFTDQGVKVYHKDRFNKDILDKEQLKKEEQIFSFYDADSSDMWAPGISIWFDHPAEVEIAIPNEQKEGAIVIKVATPHPHSSLLEHKYDDIDSACKALANFICQNTTSLSPDYKKVLTEHDKKNNLSAQLLKQEDVVEKNFLQRAPTAPPQNKQAAVTQNQNKFGSYGKDAHHTIRHDKLDTLIEQQINKDKK